MTTAARRAFPQGDRPAAAVGDHRLRAGGSRRHQRRAAARLPGRQRGNGRARRAASWMCSSATRAQSLLVLLAAVGCVLLIACVNLANLLLARGAGRSGGDRACAQRSAHRRRRIVRQLLTESLVARRAGNRLRSGPGLRIDRRCWCAGRRSSSADSTRSAIDGAVLAFTVSIALLSALAFGLVPALQAARTDPVLGAQGSLRTTAGREPATSSRCAGRRRNRDRRRPAGRRRPAAPQLRSSDAHASRASIRIMS